ncbi:hypothetical protein HDU91_007529 [Kappamyces sp. JEL0680]|nr:hypothetical protein HDU91_007529 [Kappamyces sp. JEL0680]
MSLPVVSTIALLGVQVVYSFQYSCGTLILLNLGLTRQETILVWLAGPLAGMVVQPTLGYMSDALGKRKPFIVIGSLLVAVSLLTLAYVNAVTATTGIKQKYLSILSFYLLDFSVNAIQACSRSLIADVNSMQEQARANLWASRMIQVGSIFGYIVAFIDLEALLPAGVADQVQILVWLTLLILGITVSLTCVLTPESSIARPHGQDTQFLSQMTSLLAALYHLAPIYRLVFLTQFFNWLGWFPFLYYASAWVQEADVLDSSESEVSLQRLGSLALLLSSIIALVSSLVLPKFFSKRNISLGTAWSLGLAFFCLCLWTTLLSPQTTEVKITAIAMAGISWFTTVWVPFTLLGEHLAITQVVSSRSDPGSAPGQYTRLEDELVDGRINDTIMEGIVEGSDDSDSAVRATSRKGGYQLQAGTVLGLHNIFICLPQFASSIVTVVVFQVVGDSDPFGWVLRVGALLSVFGIIFAIRTKSPEKIM